MRKTPKKQKPYTAHSSKHIDAEMLERKCQNKAVFHFTIIFLRVQIITLLRKQFHSQLTNKNQTRTCSRIHSLAYLAHQEPVNGIAQLCVVFNTFYAIGVLYNLPLLNRHPEHYFSIIICFWKGKSIFLLGLSSHLIHFYNLLSMPCTSGIQWIEQRRVEGRRETNREKEKKKKNLCGIVTITAYTNCVYTLGYSEDGNNNSTHTQIM